MRVLVTGGAGFIGSNFVRMLVRGELPGLSATETVVLDALTYSGNPHNLDELQGVEGWRLVEGDIRDAALLDSLLPGVDLLVHFAAESHVDRSVQGALPFFDTNVLGTVTLLDAARRNGVGRFLHVSTDEVYGSIPEGSWPETDPLLPNSPYSASKAGSDLAVRAFHATYGMDTVTTRCSNNYGRYQYPEKLIPLFVTNLIDGRKVPLYGDGRNVRDWLHVDDHCRGIGLAAVKGRPGEVYNIGGGTELTNREITALLLDATGRDWSSVEQVEDRLGHDLRYSVDISKASRELGYAPQVPFAAGLADTVEWYRARRDWWEPLKADR